MKVAQISDYGEASSIKLNDIDTPELTADKVLIKVNASSLNPFDSKLRSGYLKDHFPISFPYTLGGDVAGVVTEVGENVSQVAVGDKVYGQAAMIAGNSGALAEYAATIPHHIATMPINVDFAQAASLPLVGVSALQALITHLDIKEGQKLFIHGGAGGIGMVAIQIAKHFGAYVATTASEDGIRAVTELGADEVIDYTTSDFSEVLNGYDAVFDTVGGDDFEKSLLILKPGSKAVSMAGQVDEEKASALNVEAITQSTHITTEALGELAKLVEANVVTPHVSKTFPLSEVVQAFESRESGAIKGKVVIEIA